MQWTLEQMRRLCAQSGSQQLTHRNPNPAGCIHDGSTSADVLLVLERYSPRWLTFSQIVDFTGRPAKSVSWSVHHLCASGKIVARPSGDKRSSRYQMYRVVTDE